jgi:hypothetical protein
MRKAHNSLALNNVFENSDNTVLSVTYDVGDSISRSSREVRAPSVIG